MATGAACLAVTFLLLGMSYGFPFPLWPDAAGAMQVKSPATLNMYVLTAWMGLAHFVYACHGQVRALWRKRGLPQLVPFVLLLIVVWASMWGVRAAIGVTIWDALVWIYFVYHFIKAELFINDAMPGVRSSPRRDYIIPVVAFSLLSVVLIWRELWLERTELLFVISSSVAAISLMAGGWRGLFDPSRAPYVVLGMFLFGEALVWGNYARYMTATFADGVYGFHVAAASFFHYARAYAIPLARHTPGWFLSLSGIVVINLTIIATGWITGLRIPSEVPNLIWDPRYFTVWVAWHLVASDLFPKFIKPRTQASPIHTTQSNLTEKSAR